MQNGLFSCSVGEQEVVNVTDKRSKNYSKLKRIFNMQKGCDWYESHPLYEVKFFDENRIGFI